MERRAALILLSVVAAGVFLSGLELMITAVALPSIVVDLSDWTQLRHASWIINGYLLVYVVTMPLAGRLADLWGVRRLFLAALAAFTVGSLLAGLAQTLDQLIAARLVQAVGGGTLVPVGTAAASHLFRGHARPRALGVVGGVTFLGMAAGPFAGAAILGSFHPATALASLGIPDGPVAAALADPWRWIFYANVPIGFSALALGWAASGGWDTPRRTGRLDLPGAALFSLGLASLLAGLTLIDGQLAGRILDLTYPPTPLVALALLLGALAVVRELRRDNPFLDLRLFRIAALRWAALVSLLTGYALATAIVGGAVFVDRVLYGGPEQQRVALGALAGATAVGALGSGLVVRVVALRWVTVAGLALSLGALWQMMHWTPATGIGEAAAWLGLFGLGFGLTVTPRSTAAIEAVNPLQYGTASAIVTVARMIGMAVGLAILVAYGSTTIDRLTGEVYRTPDAYRDYVPSNLRDRPLRDGLVVQALETWAAGEAARILGGLFAVAGAVTLLAAGPALALGGRHRPQPGSRDVAEARRVDATGGPDDRADAEPTIAL